MTNKPSFYTQKTFQNKRLYKTWIIVNFIFLILKKKTAFSCLRSISDIFIHWKILSYLFHIKIYKCPGILPLFFITHSFKLNLRMKQILLTVLSTVLIARHTMLNYRETAPTFKEI